MLGCGVDIIILSFTHSNHVDRHNVIVDTIDHLVTRATELDSKLVFTSVEL